jgi:hypothetical protein
VSEPSPAVLRAYAEKLRELARAQDGRAVSCATLLDSVDLHADPPTVRLRNPWGSGSSTDEFITMTEDEFHHHFNELSVG